MGHARTEKLLKVSEKFLQWKLAHCLLIVGRAAVVGCSGFSPSRLRLVHLFAARCDTYVYHLSACEKAFPSPLQLPQHLSLCLLAIPASCLEMLLFKPFVYRGAEDEGVGFRFQRRMYVVGERGRRWTRWTQTEGELGCLPAAFN